MKFRDFVILSVIKLAQTEHFGKQSPARVLAARIMSLSGGRRTYLGAYRANLFVRLCNAY